MLEARLRAATTEQRHLLRTRIVLEAADGMGTREIARELETTPTTVSLWRGRFAREGLKGLDDLPRSGAPPIYGEATDQRIRAVLDQPPPKGYARWNGPLIAKALGDVDVQYVWRSLRKQKIDLSGRKITRRRGLHGSIRSSTRFQFCKDNRSPVRHSPRPNNRENTSMPSSRPTTRLLSRSSGSSQKSISGASKGAVSATSDSGY